MGLVTQFDPFGTRIHIAAQLVKIEKLSGLLGLVIHSTSYPFFDNLEFHMRNDVGKFFVDVRELQWLTSSSWT